MPSERKTATVGAVNLRKNGGRWQARWQVNGKRYSRSLGVTNLRIAEKKARLLSDLLEAGDFEAAKQFRDRPEHTFATVCDEFVQYMMDGGQWEPSTEQGYRTARRRLEHQFGGWPIASITPKDLEGFLARLMERDGLSKATRNRYLAFLKSLFKVAVRWGYAVGNPTADIKQIKETPKRTRHLTVEQLDRLMQVLKARGGLAYDVALMMADTGLRLGTVRQLRWTQVDFEQRVLFIPKTKNHDSLEVPIGDTLYGHLQRQYGQRQATNLIPLSRGRDWVFPSPADPTKPFHNIRKSLIAAGQEAGIGPVHHHMFRTSLITDMVNANINPFVTQQVVGHKNIATTQGYYRRSLGEARKAMEQVQAHRAS